MTGVDERYLTFCAEDLGEALLMEGVKHAKAVFAAATEAVTA